MATDLMPAPVEDVVEPKRGRTRRPTASSTASTTDSSVRDIIDKARSAPTQAPARAALAAAGTMALLMWASFTPLDWGPLGWVCLIPLCLLVRIEKPTRWMYSATYLGGLAFTVASFQWMRLGHPMMYFAWWALALYVAVYFPLFVALARVGVHRFRIPLVCAAPVVWVGLEFARAYFLSGFSWYYLGHSQYRWIEMIQISDVTGAYGVSFVLAAAAACAAGVLPASMLARFRLLPATADPAATKYQPNRWKQAGALTFSLGLFALVLAYGYVRRSQADFKPGPRVALVQGNFTSAVKHDKDRRSEILRTHYALTGLAVRHQPDVIVWPETMYRNPLFFASLDLSDDDLRRLAPQIPLENWRSSTDRQFLSRMAQQSSAAMIVGADVAAAEEDGFHHYNSAVLVDPDRGLTARYDKMHRVPFGEYVPFQKSLPWMARLTPYPPDFGIQPGEEAKFFEYNNWRFAPVICFEDTVPQLVRNIVRESRQVEGADGRPVDCIVNLTNDGWFHGSSELDQHLITAAFRAVECRTPIVRAVNTGISAVVDGDGVVVEPDVFIDGDARLRGKEGPRTSMRDKKSGDWHKSLNAVIVDTVPLDDRRSLYVSYGDWFAGTWAAACLLLCFAGVVCKMRDRRT